MLESRRILSTFRTCALAVVAATAAMTALAEGRTVFWIEPRSNVTLDAQTAELVGKHAGLIVLRARWNNPDPDYSLTAAVRRFKAHTSAPVLTYAWANRYTEQGRSEADQMRNFARGAVLAETKGDNNNRVDFLDITDPEVRNRVVGKFVEAHKALGVDGFAVDLSTRTPNVRPAELARRCKEQADFCPRYASAMDAMFAELKRGLGPKSFVAFNGLFNFAPGQLKDQAKLLAFTDAAAVEFFGMVPQEKSHSFSENILPFLEALPTLPPDKSVMVFGRGPWAYTDYAEDYRWQRYLYANFLLAARPKDLFKYHATFQAPTGRGRTGGLDFYDDWEIDLGAARGGYKVSDGIYWREFAKGLVAVAPDDGRRGGTLTLPRRMFTPEGKGHEGRVRLEPGEGMILLADPEERRKPATREINARTIAGWKWGGTRLETVDGREVVVVNPSKQPGDHDVMLDFERSANPYGRVEIEARLLDKNSVIQLVAEVDDPRQQASQVVVELSLDDRTGLSMEDAVPYRAHTREAGGENWPRIRVKRAIANGMAGVGAAALEGTGYQFRRWSHLRLVGSVEVTRITLSNPVDRLGDRR